ncbi:hypothetical protein ACFC14_18210 [Microbacterium sp. NPDC055988]|uniref:hypothetical protein n=1 Tax=Microbacterium sp. NPDC055988 TaxID=3345671 RepID=UPI0035DAA1F2
MEWLTLVTALIAVGGTLGGVALTQRAAAKQAERDREVVQQKEQDARLRDAALVTAKLFRKELDAVLSITRDQSDEDIDRQMKILDKKLEEHIHSPSTSDLRLAIILIPDSEAREQLSAIMGAYAQSLSIEGGLAGAHSSFIAGSILQSGNQISAAYARGEKPGEYEMRQYQKFTTWAPGGKVDSPSPR